MTAIYSFFILTILAIEQDIYSFTAGILISEIAELFFMIFFFVEIMVYLISFGPRLYFKDKLNYLEIIFILATIAWHMLDIKHNSMNFREKGAFRVVRVTLMI